MGAGHTRFPTPPQWMRIGTRRLPKPRPREAAPFDSVLGKDPLPCPVCTHADGPHRGSTGSLTLSGNLWPCESCDGVFVENAAFEAMVAEMARAPWELPATAGAPGKRMCPACKKPMVTESLGSVAEIDRCAEHGIWFDESELGEALATTVPPEGGMVSWLKNIFFK